MSFRWERVVEIARKRGNETTCCGSGTLIAKGCVLTAKHVVMHADKPKPDLFVRLDKKEYVSASIGWFGKDDLDVALLVADLVLDRLESPLLLLSERDIQAGEQWEAKGFPEVVKENPVNDARKYGDKTQSWTPLDPFLILKEYGHPESWAGLSGAAIVIGKQIVGVMRSYEHGHDNNRLRATPVHAFIRDPEFRKILGITSQDEQLARDIQRRQAEIVQRLQERYVLCTKLAGKLGAREDAFDIASALFERSADAVARGLADLDASPDLVPVDRDIVRKMLWETLPLAVDWRDVLLCVQKSVEEGQSSIELPLRTETMAEVILAGVDGRSCSLVDAKPFPRGSASIPMPSAMHAPLFNMQQHAVSAMVKDLFDEKNLGARAFQPFRGMPLQTADQIEEARVLVDELLADWSRKDNPDRMPHYLLFVDHLLRTDASVDLDKLWADLCSACAAKLPHLRLFRLRGGPKEFAKEVKVVLQLQKPLGK